MLRVGGKFEEKLHAQSRAWSDRSINTDARVVADHARGWFCGTEGPAAASTTLKHFLYPKARPLS